MRDLETEIETDCRTLYLDALFAAVAKVLCVGATPFCSCGGARSCNQ